MPTKKSLTAEQYKVLDDAYKFFNKQLFSNQLPQVMIVLHRKGKRNLGYFHAERFLDKQAYQEAVKHPTKSKKKEVAKIDELSLNPDNFISYTDTAIMSTLVHEMVHVWQFHCTEKFPRNGYHDKVWGRKMEEIGLMPSNTGTEGGKKTGQQMHHYIIQNGKFERSCLQFMKNKSIKLTSFPLAGMSTSQNKNKVKYSCSCTNVWGKPGLSLTCNECNEEFIEA